MKITLDIQELRSICKDMSELGAAQYVRKTKPAVDLMSQREAYKMFGESRVKRWVAAGMVKAMRSGETQRSKLLYSMADMMSLDASERLQPIIARNLN